jgi:hypothetical protein
VAAASGTDGFQFEERALPHQPGMPMKSIRQVHPDLQRIVSWISSVGAGVALHDIDGDGLPNDVCLVDPRTDTAMVAPAPGTPERYQPFALAFAPLPYDAATMAPTDCLPGDVNEDGLTDIIVSFWGRAPIAMLQRPGQGALSAASFLPREVVGPQERWFTDSATMADLDGDGHLDLIIGNYFPDGDRVLDAHATDHVWMQDSMSRAYNGGGAHFLRWTGGQGGPEPSVAYQWQKDVLTGPASRGWTLAVGAADLDDDMLPELYLSNDFGPDRLLVNLSEPGHFRFRLAEGKLSFLTPGSYVLGRDSFKGMGVEFADLNGDGLLDMTVSNISASYGLMESHFVWVNQGHPELLKQGIAPFINRSDELGVTASGWGWDIKAGDFNNDGTPEIVQATGFVRGTVNRWAELHEVATSNDTLLHNPAVWPRLGPGTEIEGHSLNPFYAKGPGGRYVDLARQSGLAVPRVTRGIAMADVNGDGALDFATATQWGDSVMELNQCPSCGQSLGLHLLLPLTPGAATGIADGAKAVGAGRPAVGAVVTVTLPDGRTQTTQIDGGNGHSGKRAPDAFFGLGAVPADASLPVAITWRDPDGKVRHEQLTVKPGWHTVLLGWQKGGQ